MEQAFGGSWTEQKLVAVEKYLRAYTTLMRSNERAKHFRITYLDGFAGSGRGYRNSGSLFENLQGEEEDFYVGSAIRALMVQPPFDQFIFIDQKTEYLETLKGTVINAGLDISRCAF